MLAPETGLLVYCEDPGAANYMQVLSKWLKDGYVDYKFVLESDSCIEFFPELRLTTSDLSEAFIGSCSLWGNKFSFVFGISENIDSKAFDCVVACRLKGVKTIAFVDSVHNYSYRFRGRSADPLSYLPDHLVVPTESVKQKYRSLGVKDDCVSIIPHPAIQGWGEKWVRSINVKSGSKLRIVFASELDSGLRDIYAGFDSDSSHINEQSKPSNVVGNFVRFIGPMRENLHLILRLHPKQTPQDYRDLANYFDEISWRTNSALLFQRVDLVIGLTSIFLGEAVAHGVPAFSLVLNSVDRGWTKAMGLELVTEIESFEELKILLDDPEKINHAIRCSQSREVSSREDSNCDSLSLGNILLYRS